MPGDHVSHAPAEVFRLQVEADLAAEVEVVEPTGAETMIVIRLGGSEVIARVDPDEAQAPGSLMRFAIDMRKACLFDPASEQLI